MVENQLLHHQLELAKDIQLMAKKNCCDQIEQVVDGGGDCI